MAQATFGGGCFWCTEAVMEQLDGVADVVSGYAGGASDNPTYDQVCSGRTGHAEVVQVTFDEQVVSYRQLLEVFFLTHDPTTLNRQGNDIGTQYRSVIFYHDEAQREVAQATKDELNADVFGGRIVTEVEPLPKFYPAEDYHQDYYRRHGEQPYCRVVIDPKMAKLRERFADQLRAV